MNNRLMKVLLMFGLSYLGSPTFAQNTKAKNENIRIEVHEGSFSKNLNNKQIPVVLIENTLGTSLGLSNDFSFSKEKEHTDNNGIKHTTYRQYYSGIKVENGSVLLHSRNNIATSINGKIMTNPQDRLHINPVINPKEAIETAKKELDITTTINNYKPELVLYPSSEGATLAFKVRIDGFSTRKLFLMYHVYVNAINGKVLHRISLIAHADVPANAQTYYSGMRTITTDSYLDRYRLRDNARKIETYNVKGQFMNQTPPAFTNPNDVSHTATTWLPQLTLMSTTLEHAADSLRFTGLYDVQVSFQSGWLLRSSIDAFIAPSSYQNVKDGLLLPNFMSNIPPVVTLPVTDAGLDLVVNAPSYRGTFRKDSASIDFDINTMSISATTHSYDTNVIQYTMDTLTPGTFNWLNAHGDKGTYTVALAANPALDVHWGMEQTHDFYKTAFNYISYDNSDTSVVRNYYDGTLGVVGTQNNAAALPAPFNCMIFGTGDGQFMNPVVSLDIEGHEFTHLVTSNTSALSNNGEAAALNESFSDMMGQAIVYYAKGPDSVTWHTGEGVVIPVPYMRSLSEPKAPAAFSDTSIKPSPDTYYGEYWDSSANADAHQNGGVSNKWFFLLAQGGSGTNDNQYAYNITGLGMSKAQKIAFTTFTQYLTSTAGFMDAYNNSLQATEDIYGAASTEYNTVKAAWKAVGIPRGDTTTTDIDPLSWITNSIEMYPNPTDGIITIKSSLTKNITVSIFNLIGNKVMESAIKPGVNSIDMSSFSKGIYIAKYKTGTDSYSQKIVYR